MTAIFKREYRSFFLTPLGYVFCGVFALIAGIFFVLGNVFTGYGDLKPLFSNILSMLMFIIPALTMKLLSEEKKLKTDQVLLTSPVSVSDIVLGKFFASCAVFLTALVFTIPYVFIIVFAGQLEIWAVLGNYLAISLVAGIFISIGLMISAITENQLIAAVVTFIALLALSFLDSFASSSTNIPLQKIGLWLSVYSRYNNFTLGIFNIADIIFYCSMIVVFLFFTVRIIEKRRYS